MGWSHQPENHFIQNVCFCLRCYDSTRSEMHLELKAVRDINNSHIRKSTCLYTHLYTFIFVQLINSIENHCKDDISWDISLKHKTWGSVKIHRPCRLWTFRFVVFQPTVFAGRCLEDVSGESHAGREGIAGARRSRVSCWREFGGWGVQGGLPLGMYSIPLSPPTEVTPKKGWIGILLMFCLGLGWWGIRAPPPKFQEREKKPWKMVVPERKTKSGVFIGFRLLFRGVFC